MRLTPHGNTNSAVDIGARHGNCYPLAYAYASSLKSDDARLVIGKVGQNAEPSDEDVDHAWVIESDGWVWEPTNDAWFHDEGAFTDSMMHGRARLSFTPSEARELRERGAPIGPWSPEAKPADTAQEDGA